MHWSFRCSYTLVTRACRPAISSSCIHTLCADCIVIYYYFSLWCPLANRSTSSILRCGLAHLQLKAVCASVRLRAWPLIKCNLYAHFLAALLYRCGMANRKLDYFNCNLVKVLVVYERVSFALLNIRYKYSDFIWSTLLADGQVVEVARNA